MKVEIRHAVVCSSREYLCGFVLALLWKDKNYGISEEEPRCDGSQQSTTNNKARKKQTAWIWNVICIASRLVSTAKLFETPSVLRTRGWWLCSIILYIVFISIQSLPISRHLFLDHSKFATNGHMTGRVQTDLWSILPCRRWCTCSWSWGTSPSGLLPPGRWMTPPWTGAGRRTPGGGHLLLWRGHQSPWDRMETPFVRWYIIF